MKLSNIFKKASKATVATSNVQKLEKTQLEKVIGGNGDPAPPETLAGRNYNSGKSNTSGL